MRTPPAPPPYDFGAGARQGAGEALAGVISSIDPRNVVSGIDHLIHHFLVGSLFRAAVEGVTHYQEFKGIWDAYQSGDSYLAGEYTGKLIVELGADLLTTIVGAKAAKLVGDAIRGASATSKVVESAGTAAEGAGEAASGTNKIYSARVLTRMVDEPGPMHNFPGSFDDAVFEHGSRTLNPGYFNKAKANLSDDSIQYRLSGEINGKPGTFEIFTRPSVSGRSELITHRFFRPGY